MSRDRRRRVEEIFERALDRSAGERGAYVADECRSDTELEREVNQLLEAHELAEQLFPDTLSGPDEELHVGPYRVLRELGRGGMGVVYLAERADGQYRRRVAVKLIATARADDPVYRRFLTERQILAGLDHPNIARLLDGGLTEDRRPYLVLEYVDGVPISVYCDRHRLTVRQRLELFLQVCAAVQHAHQSLVIHRDLKPGNILVASNGRVRLLDFGIAKLLNAELASSDPPLTRIDRRVMTPEYASPEQVRGDPLTTSSDIYSLGTLLYELLTGSPPYRLETGSPVEMLDAVCYRDPERPSTRVLETEPLRSGTVEREEDGDALTPELRARQRGLTPERLRRVLRGDLDSIVMMALRKEPERRYGSADLLAEDIRRHIDGQPVRAHIGSARYRAGKFVRRHWQGTLAASVVLASLLVGASAASWQASLAGAARDHAETERSNAELALRQSEAVTQFLVELFEASDPDLGRGDGITARELLQRGVERAQALHEEPDVQARMLGVIGRVYQSIGDYSSAEPLLARALEVESATHGPHSPHLVVPLTDLADLHRRLARYDSSRRLLERALRIQHASTATDSALGATLQQLSRTALAAGELETAERLGREAVDLHRRQLGGHHPVTVGSTIDLSRLLRERGNAMDAEQVLRMALPAVQSGSAPAERGLLIELADLLHLERRNAAEAEPLYRRALVTLRGEAPRNSSDLVRALGGLARILEERGELQAAEALLRESLDVRRGVYGDEHPNVSAALVHLAGFYERTGRPAQAEALFRSAAAVDVKLFGEEHPTHAGTLGAIARTLIAQDRLEEADELLRRQLAIRIASLGPDHRLTGRSLFWRAEVLLRKGELTEAESLLRQALRIATAETSGDTAPIREIRDRLAEVEARQARGTATQRAAAGTGPG
jgi:eukaryotic-like serine/threonine-protein kinase